MQNNKKYKIAVCIGGELRKWKITQHLFNSFHGRYEDVDVDFFISTWNPIKERDSSGDVWLQEDVINSLDRLKGYEFLDKDCEQLNTSNQMKYYYLMYRCNLLKSEYELENNFNYDCVLASRPDMAIEDIAALREGKDYERTIDALYQFMMVYDGEKSNRISRGELVVGGLWWNPSAKYFGGYSSMDTVFWGRSSTMDIFTQVYKYVWNSKLFNSIERMHSLPPSWSRYAGLVPMGNQHSPGVIMNILRRENEEEYKKYFETEECLCQL